MDGGGARVCKANGGRLMYGVCARVCALWAHIIPRSPLPLYTTLAHRLGCIYLNRGHALRLHEVVDGRRVGVFQKPVHTRSHVRQNETVAGHKVKGGRRDAVVFPVPAPVPVPGPGRGRRRRRRTHLLEHRLPALRRPAHDRDRGAGLCEADGDAAADAGGAAHHDGGLAAEGDLDVPGAGGGEGHGFLLEGGEKKGGCEHARKCGEHPGCHDAATGTCGAVWDRRARETLRPYLFSRSL